MPLLLVRAVTRPALVGAVAAMTLLPACGAPPPSADGVAPILLTEGERVAPGPDVGARPVELPDPARAGEVDDDAPARREPRPDPEGDDDADDEPDPPELPDDPDDADDSDDTPPAPPAPDADLDDADEDDEDDEDSADGDAEDSADGDEDD